MSALITVLVGQEVAFAFVLATAPIADAPSRLRSVAVNCRSGEPPQGFSIVISGEDAFADARKFAAGLDPALAVQALRAISWLDAEVRLHSIANLPPIDGRLLDDGSAILEIRFPDRRLAFTLEPKSEESGWHMVSKASAGGFFAHGPLSGKLSLPLAWFAAGPR